MAIHTGMRRGEIFKLRWFDVDFSRGVIHVKDTKAAKDRDVPMSGAVREMLERQPKTGGHKNEEGRPGTAAPQLEKLSKA